MAIKDSNEDELKKDDNTEDNFGLPDIEYKPLDQKEEEVHIKEEVTSTPTSTYTSSESTTYKSSFDESAPEEYDDEPSSKAPIILSIIFVLVLAVAGYLVYNYWYKPKQADKAEKARQEQLAKEAVEKQKAEEARLALLAAAEKKRLDSIANAKPLIGTIETVSGRTKRYYVVVTSDIDDDLLMDYAKKLSLKGVSTKIIPPFGDKKFYRLTIADQETFAEAQTSADAAKAEYGNAVWVIRY
ncbi:hypothetical protein BH09BAC3_BH09BAC3_35490 [soil metagenome]